MLILISVGESSIVTWILPVFGETALKLFLIKFVMTCLILSESWLITTSLVFEVNSMLFLSASGNSAFTELHTVSLMFFTSFFILN